MEAVLSVVEHISKERDQLLHMVLMLIILNTHTHTLFSRSTYIFMLFTPTYGTAKNLDITNGLNIHSIIYCTKMSAVFQFPPTAYFSYFCPL